MSADFHARRLFRPSSRDSAVMVRTGAPASDKREVYVQSSPDSAVMVAVPAVGRNAEDYSILDPYGRAGVPTRTPMDGLYARSVARQFPSYGYAGMDDRNSKWKVSNVDGRKVLWYWIDPWTGTVSEADEIFVYYPNDLSGTYKEDVELARKARAGVIFEGTEAAAREIYDGKVAAPKVAAGSTGSAAPSAGASAGPTPAVPAGTWNDGTWTYEVAADGSVLAKGPKLPAEGKKFTMEDSKFQTDLATDYATGKLKKGVAPAKAASSAPATPVSAAAATAISPDPFYKKSWFIYTAAGVGVLGLAGLIIFSGGGSKKKLAQEQAA